MPIANHTQTDLGVVEVCVACLWAFTVAAGRQSVSLSPWFADIYNHASRIVGRDELTCT